ncbi:MAG: FecR domain-containing protein, partial [Acidiferrobacterales bacterium]
MMDGFKRSLYVGSLLLFFVVWCVPVHAAFKPAGEVILTNGTFLAIQADSSTRSLARGSEFYQGDRLWTGPRTKAQIRFSDGAIMTLRPDTEFSVDEYEFDDKNADRNKSLFTLVKGGFRTLTGLISRLRPDSYKIKTAYAIVGVRGTTYEALVENALWVAAWQGNISVENDGGEVNLGFGEDHNFARVTSFTAAPTGMLATPPQLLESIDPDLQEVAVVDPTDTRLVTGLLQDGN